jgi:hypothetical protein
MQKMFLVIVISSLLSGCYTNEVDLSQGSGHIDTLPVNMFLAGEDGESGLVLKKESKGYSTSTDGQRLMIMPIATNLGHYWAQISRTDSEGKVSYYSFAVEVDGNSVATLMGDLSAVESSAEIRSRAKADLDDPASKRTRYKIIDLSNSAGRAQALAFIQKAEAKNADDARDDTPSTPPKQAGQFYFQSERDAITGATKQFIFGFPSGFEVGKPPYIRLGCYGRNDQYPVGLTINWGTPVRDIYPEGQFAASYITVKFGSEAPLDLGVSVSQNLVETYPPDAGTALSSKLAQGFLGALAPNATISKIQWSWEPDVMHRAFRSFDKVVIRAYPRSGGDITLSFDTSDFKDVLKNFKSHCQRV